MPYHSPLSVSISIRPSQVNVVSIPFASAANSYIESELFFQLRIMPLSSLKSISTIPTLYNRHKEG